MTSPRRAIAALVAVGLVAAPFAAEAKRYRAVRHHGTGVPIQTYGSAGLPTTQPTQPRTYGSSGLSIGTVTAPSIGSYNWPSVGVTNAVPTWSNTNPR
jgi:hypothetical protein